MSVRLKLNERDGLCFITSTCQGRHPLFDCTGNKNGCSFQNSLFT